MSQSFVLITICSEERPESHDPHSMLKGMKGYQLTAADLEFLKKMKEEQVVKKMQVGLIYVHFTMNSYSALIQLDVLAVLRLN